MNALRSILILVILLFGSIGTVRGAESAWNCEGCSQSQYYARALSEAQNQGRHGLLVFVFVYDISGNNLLKYQVGGEPGSGGTWEYELILVSTTTDEQNAFNVQRAAIEANGGSALFPFQVNSNSQGFPYPNTSTFDIVDTSAYLYNVGNYILTSNIASNNIGLGIVNLVNAAGTMFLKQDIISLDVVITFYDGGFIELTWHAGQTGGMTLVDARDVNHNEIPRPPSGPSGRYVFHEGGSGPFGNYLNGNFGTNIPNVPTCTNGYLQCTTVSGGGGVRYQCFWFNCE